MATALQDTYLACEMLLEKDQARFKKVISNMLIRLAVHKTIHEYWRWDVL